MTPPVIERSIAKACAWIWTCPICGVRLTIIRTPEGFTPQQPLCPHAIAPAQDGPALEMTYTRGEV